MTALDRLANLPDDEFVTLWHGAGTIDEVVTSVGGRVGRVPRWVVMARAALRKEGAELKRLVPAPGPG